MVVFIAFAVFRNNNGALYPLALHHFDELNYTWIESRKPHFTSKQSEVRNDNQIQLSTRQ